MTTLQEVHGDGKCDICGKPKVGPGNQYCSYPHGMVPDKQIGGTGGMWSWKAPEDETRVNGEIAK